MRLPCPALRLFAVGLAVLLIAGGVPTAQATIEFEQALVFVGPQSIEAQLKGEVIRGQDAQGLRQQIDTEYGDGDGTVDPDEVEAFLAAKKGEFNFALGFVGRSLFGNFTVNGNAPDQVQITAMHLSDSVLGSVASEADVIHDIEAVIDYPSTSRTRVEVAFMEDFSAPFKRQGVDMHWGEALFRPATGWIIDPDSIAPDGEGNPFFDGEGFLVGSGESAAFSSSAQPLTFEIYTEGGGSGGGSKGSPGPAGLLLVLVVVAGAALGRRRRR